MLYPGKEVPEQDMTLRCDTCLGDETSIDLLALPEYEEENKEVKYKEDQTLKISSLESQIASIEIPERLLPLRHSSTLTPEKTIIQDETSEIESLLTEIDQDR